MFQSKATEAGLNNYKIPFILKKFSIITDLSQIIVGKIKVLESTQKVTKSTQKILIRTQKVT